MRNRSLVPLIAVAAALLATLFLIPATEAEEKRTDKVYAAPDEEKATVYFIRTKRFQGSSRTLFLYAGDSFLGVLANDSYTFAYLEPGEHFLWLNWARVNRKAEFEPGQTYYFTAWESIIDLPEDEGRRRVEEAKFYCRPSDKEIATSKKHISERGAKAEKFAEADTGERWGTEGERNKHMASWPKVDLSIYSLLVIEDFAVTDPKAGKRKKQDLLSTAPARVANIVRADLDKGTFDEVLRGKLDGRREGALVLRVELTQYKPGSKAGRFMVAGAGVARLDFLARLIDGSTGEELASFSDERAYGWGGMMGAAGGIETIEKNLAYELATYLELQVRGAAGD